jgi:hypothetical protein
MPDSILRSAQDDGYSAQDDARDTRSSPALASPAYTSSYGDRSAIDRYHPAASRPRPAASSSRALRNRCDANVKNGEATVS